MTIIKELKNQIAALEHDRAEPDLDSESGNDIDCKLAELRAELAREEEIERKGHVW